MACDAAKSASNASEMFGLGVRIGYYIQWYALILEERFLPPDMQAIRISLMTFVAATALAILIQLPSLEPVVIYITLLLTFGYWYHLIFVAAGFIAAQTRKEWRRKWTAPVFPRYLKNDVVEVLWLVLLIGVLAILVYFWTNKVPTSDDDTVQCGQRYGFFFARIRLNNQPFRVFNLVLSAILLAAVAAQALFRLVPSERSATAKLSLRSIKWPGSRSDEGKLLNLRATMQLIICTTILVATELCIRWNHFEVNSLTGTGQLIPVFIASVIFLRVLFRIFMRNMTEERLDILQNAVPRLIL